MATDLSLFSELKLFANFAAGLRAYLAKPLTPEECLRRLQDGLKSRESGLLDVVRNGIYAVEDSPYRKLLAHAQITLRDIEDSVHRLGIEDTLQFLLESGVYLTLDEFKGRKPIRRGNLELTVSTRDFDNPMTIGQIESRTGGSRSTGTRISMDLTHYEQDAIYDYISDLSFGMLDRPCALWKPVPPFSTGLKSTMSYLKTGRRVERWFSQNKRGVSSQAIKHYASTTLAILASRFIGPPIPSPQHVPLREARRIAEWLAENTAAGTYAYLNTNVASAVRIVLAAKDNNLDITESFFRVGGEPLTEAKAAIIASAGCEVRSHYSMGEQGRLGIGCASPNAIDDVHILLDKIAVIQKEKILDGNNTIQANFYTSLMSTPPKLMLNVESGDYGVLERRDCGCRIGELGFALHFNSIRSYEKLTSEGMNFLGSDLLRLVEEVLPTMFGGNSLDYQLLESEVQGLPKVNLVVSPRVGSISDTAVIATVIEFLNTCSGGKGRYGQRWSEGNTLRILRQDPITTGAASKVHALHVLKSSED